ncbi:MAG: restriction endonuclease subunit S [Flavobacteriales bacterium]
MSEQKMAQATTINNRGDSWQLMELRELIEERRSIRYGIVQPGDFDANGRFMVRGQDYSFGWVEPSKLFRVSDSVEAKYKNARLKAGDLIITIVGAGTGTVAIVPDWLEGANCTQTTARIAIDPEKAYSSYIYHFLNSSFGRKLTYENIKGGAQPGLNCGDIERFIIPLPPLPEQRAIARVLSTWDDAIRRTEQLIAQKELRKKWLMQNLLTGKMRLKGFEGEWRKVGAGDVFKSISKKGFSNEELLSATQDRGMIPRTMLEGRVTMPTSGTEGFKLVEIGDFVISLRSFQGGLEYSEYRGLVSPAYTVLKPKKSISEEFYKQYFKSEEFIGRLATAVIGIRDGKQISYDDFCVVKIPSPSIDEQTAIASVLQTADKEIDILKSKLEKQREQKKGLMQVLLTGRLRLKIHDL